MITDAIVKKIIDDKTAVIEVKRKSACGDNCASCKGCNNKDKTIKAVAVNEISASVGDYVLVETDTKYVLKNAFYLYILPFILFFLFYFISVNTIDVLSELLACVGFLVGILIVYLHSKRPETKNKFVIVNKP